MYTKSYENIFLYALFYILRRRKNIPIHADSICVHGDGEKAFAFIEQIHKVFLKEGIEICPLAKVINSQT